jgi:ribonuclease P protein component
VSIATSQFKKATDRNKAKRICFKLAQNHLGLLPNNLNLVIMPRAQILTEKFENLSTQFNNAISSLKTN